MALTGFLTADGWRMDRIAPQAPESGARVRSILGAPIDLVALSGLPAGASFSGSGSYASAGVLAVQSTGTITHNPTGWSDGTACLEFTPNTDSSAEFRIFVTAGLNISDDDGIGFEFYIPNVDTTKSNFVVFFEYSADAVSLFPTNMNTLSVWRDDNTVATSKEREGYKYIRQRWDHDATDANCGAWPGYAITSTGTGSDRNLTQKWIRFRMSKFSGVTLKFKTIRRGGVSTPAFVVGTDNLTPEDLALRLFGYASKKGVPTYLNQYLASVSTNLERLRRIYAAGVDVTGNDVVDRSIATVTDQPTMQSAVTTTRDTLLGYGFERGNKIWVTNNNQSSALFIAELVKAGYIANRNGATDGRYVFPEGGVPDRYRIPAISVDNLNFTAIQPLIDRAILTGCTLWPYSHAILSTARMDADRTANVTGTAGAPVARSGTESLIAYRARAAALGTAAGTASVTYFDARVGSSGLGIWYEEWSQMIDYLATKAADGACVVLSPEDWCTDVGIA